MATHPEFGAKTTATEVAVAFSDRIRDKHVVITGVSPKGIGFATALAIASGSPASLVLASRTESKLAAAAETIKQAHPSVQIHTVPLDLSSPDSIKSAAAKITTLLPRLDVLINNAGGSLQRRDRLATPSGDTVVDLSFMTNHLGPFLLTALLLPHLAAAGTARVVNLTSMGHRLSPIRFADYAFLQPPYSPDIPPSEHPLRNLPPGLTRTTEEEGYPGFLAYAQAKTANVLFTTELARRSRAAGKGVVALSVHPGTIETELSRHLDDEGRRVIQGTAPGGVWKSLDEGAATTVVAAFDPKLAAVEVGWGEGEEAGYMIDCQLAVPAAHARDGGVARRLWEESERMLGVRVGY